MLLLLQTTRAITNVVFLSTSHTNIRQPNLHPPLHHVFITSRLGGGAAASIQQTTGSRSAVEGEQLTIRTNPLRGSGFQPLFRGAFLKKYQGEVESPRPGKRRLILLMVNLVDRLMVRGGPCSNMYFLVLEVSTYQKHIFVNGIIYYHFSIFICRVM